MGINQKAKLFKLLAMTIKVYYPPPAMTIKTAPKPQ